MKNLVHSAQARRSHAHGRDGRSDEPGRPRGPQVHHALRHLPGASRASTRCATLIDKTTVRRRRADGVAHGHHQRDRSDDGRRRGRRGDGRRSHRRRRSQAQMDDAPVVKLINAILTDAVKRGASDIHFECFEHEIRVRYRIDGALQEVMKPPMKLQGGAHLALQDHVAAEHRRAPRAAGRPHQAEDGQQGHRLPRLDAAHAVRREDRAPNSRQGQPDARPREVRHRAARRAGPDGGGARIRTAWCSSPARRARARRRRSTRRCRRSTDRRQHHDRRGSRRVQPLRDQPGARAQRDRHDVRGGAEGVPAAGPEHHHGRRDPRSRNGRHRDQGGAHGPHGAVDAAHELGAGNGDASARHGTRAVQRGVARSTSFWRSDWCVDLLELQDEVRARVPRSSTAAKVKRETTMRELEFTEEALRNAKKKATKEALPFLENLSLDTTIGELRLLQGHAAATRATARASKAARASTRSWS